MRNGLFFPYSVLISVFYLETIIQNNMSMKNQYERIQAWQKDVQEVHKAHKDKLFEAKEIIDKVDLVYRNFVQI